MRQLTSLDAQFLAIESPRTYGHVSSYAVYDPSTAPDGELTVKHLCRLVSERIHLLPPFRWRLATVPFGIDLPYWIEDPDFNLDFHIRESAVPPPGDDRQVAETVARIFARPLDRSRPLWELYLIHGLAGGRVALMTKIHHSVVDGVSGNEILSVLLDQSPEGRDITPPEGEAGERAPSDVAMLARGIAGLPKQPLRALKAVPGAVPNLTDLPGANAFPGVPTLSKGIARARLMLGDDSPQVLEATTARPPRTPFNGPISPHRRFSFGSLSLETVKRIKSETGATVNDVVVAMCAGAVRQWLLARDALPEDPLVAMIPVSVRREEERGDWGNRVSAMIVPIPTDVADPKGRIERAHELLMGAKSRHKALPANLMTDASNFIPPAVQALAARTTMGILGRTRPPLNLVISNVPGPRESLYLAGAELEHYFPVSAIVHGVGLNITVLSYKDSLDFGIVTDRDQIDDAWELMDHMSAELDALEEAVLGSAETAGA